MKRKILSKKEIKELNAQIAIYGYSYDKKDFVEFIEEDNLKQIKKDQKLDFFYHNEKIVPSLRLVLENSVELKSIVVDMGAVKFVINGADIMRPGIVEIQDGIKRGDVIKIVDTNHKKPLAVGIAQYDSEEMKKLENGKTIINIHYVGDEIWNSSS